MQKKLFGQKSEKGKTWSAKLFVRKHFVEVVKCPKCGKDESNDTNQGDISKCIFRKAIPSKSLIPHSFCSEELLAHILYEKYCKAVPLYRLEKNFEALRFRISIKTMSIWFIDKRNIIYQ